MVEALGVACGDVAGDAFVKTEFGEEAKSASEALLAVAAFFGGGREDGRARHALHKVTERGLGSGRRWLRHQNLLGTRVRGGGKNFAPARSRWEEEYQGGYQDFQKGKRPEAAGAFRESREKSNRSKIRATAWSELYWVRAWRPASAASGHRLSPDKPGRRGGRCPG